MDSLVSVPGAAIGNDLLDQFTELNKIIVAILREYLRREGNLLSPTGHRRDDKGLSNHADGLRRSLIGCSAIQKPA